MFCNSIEDETQSVIDDCVSPHVLIQIKLIDWSNKRQTLKTLSITESVKPNKFYFIL